MKLREAKYLDKKIMTLIGMLKRNMEKSSKKAAIIYHNIRISYTELDEAVNKIANALIDAGIKKGDRIGIVLPRIPELVISFLGVAKVCGIAVPINFELLEDKVRGILTDTSPRCVIVHKQFLGLLKRSIPPDSKVMIIVVGEKNTADGLCWEEILRDGSPDDLPLDVDEDDVVYLNYTSGSAGNSKGAVTTHSNIYWNTFAAVNALKLSSDDVHLCMFAPFAHPHEIFARPLYLGGTMVLLDKIYPKSIAEVISVNGVTCMMGLSPMYEMLLEAIEHKAYDLSSLRVPESGGMYTRTELIERFRKKIGVPILPVWGSTETTGIAIANIPGERQLPGSVGKPCPTYEVAIVDENNEETSAGETGEMIFRGPAVVQCYYKDSGNSDNYFKEGWYYSGDLGRKDEDGNFFFIDRKSGMMKVAGLKVYPMEIELVLMEHPDIKEAAVISSNDKLRGEVPKAIIVTRNGKELTEKEILEFCRERIPNYKIPRIVEFKESLPKIGSGKINKKELLVEEALKH